jgi:hypothetical protein
MTDDIQQEVVMEISAPPEVAVGVYAAQCTGLRRVDYVDKITGEDRTIIAWQFNVVVDDGDPMQLEGTTSMATGPASKAYGWIAALLGPAAVSPHARISASQLTGKTCLVTVGPDKNGWPKILEVTATPRTPSRAPGSPASD